jgi:hypothetical protein
MGNEHNVLTYSKILAKIMKEFFLNKTMSDFFLNKTKDFFLNKNNVIKTFSPLVTGIEVTFDMSTARGTLIKIMNISQ